jgi:DNA-binding LacI/PurR family transcriptional regulator
MVEIDMPKNAKIVKKYPRVLKELRSKIRKGYFSGVLPGVQKLAREFDVNFMTVNKAINILVEEKLLYRIPNKGTFIRKTFRIALVFLFKKDNRNQRRYTVYDDLIHGVENELNENNITMIFQNIDPESESFKLEKIKQEADGLIVLGDLHNSKANEILEGFPVVRVMGMIDNHDTIAHVTFNNYSIGQMAAEYMLCRGYEKCAFICCNNRELLIDRGRAFCETLIKAGKHGSMLTEKYVGREHKSYQDSIIAQLEGMLKEESRPSGLFIPAAWMAGDIYSLLSSRGVIPGKDIEIITCDKELMALSKLVPLPTYVDLHSDLVGKKAVEVLSKIIEKPDCKREKILLEPTLVEN